MTEPVSLAARRWSSGSDNPSAFSVRDCLEAALAQFDAGEIKAMHVIIAFGDNTDGTGFENVMQAGSFDIYGQAGLIERAKKLIVEGADA